ncbi:MFS transporter [Gemmatimonadetes bacterium T265]|nr:MFS transporter [Gemmatimonadetes bacterium T265]
MATAALPPASRAESSRPGAPRVEPAPSRFALPTVTALFFAWGFLTALNDILVPHLRGVFALNYTRAALVQFTFFGAYFLTALPWGQVVTRVGYKRGIVLGLVVAGVGALLFYPAAGLLSYGLFLTALFVLAAGITLLQVAANPYVAVLGRPETASSRLVLTQAFNSFGTTLAPLLGGLLIFAAGGAAATDAQRLATAKTVQGPYVGLAVALFVLAGVMAAARLPRLAIEDAPPAAGAPGAAAPATVWRVRHLVLGAVGIFVYVGAEVTIGSFLINFVGEPRIAGLPAAQAARYVAYYWGGAMVGRFVGAALLQRYSPRRMLALFAATAAVLTMVAVLATGHVAMWALLSVGLFNSIMFPTIFALAIEGLGHRTGAGSSVLVMAIVGGALVPLAYGALADRVGLQPAFVLPVVCYLYVVYYGLGGAARRVVG